MIHYLLGLLPEVEREQLEAGFLADECLFEEMLAVEDELIDDYVSGHLSESYREGFERYFLRLDERRQRLKFAMAFRVYSTKSNAVSSFNIPRQGWWHRLISILGIKRSMF